MRAVILLFALSFSAVAESAPSADDIVARMTVMNAARTAALHQYRSTRTYQVNYKGFPKGASAKVVVRLDYIAPDNKHFEIVSQEGSGLLIGRVIKKALESEQEAAKPEYHDRSALIHANYDFKLIGSDTENNRPCYLLEVTPKRADKYLYNGRICVDSADYAVVRIDARPAKNPSIWISRAYILSRTHKVGDFWFPGTTRSTSHVRLGGDAELNIDYGDYQIINATAVQTPNLSSAAAP